MGPAMTDTLRLEHGIRAPGRARLWIIERCHDWDCDELADAAAVLVTELVTNVFLHARTDCLVHAEFDHPVLKVTVTDEDNQELEPQPPSDTAEEGRGLAIVAALADTWGIRRSDGAKSVWFRLGSIEELRS
jgi:anti-sigma regulatory factor (Ser/Thr protein kinase)